MKGLPLWSGKRTLIDPLQPISHVSRTSAVQRKVRISPLYSIAAVQVDITTMLDFDSWMHDEETWGFLLCKLLGHDIRSDHP